MSSLCRTRRWIGAIAALILLTVGTTGSMAADTAPVKQVNVLGSSIVHGKNLADSRQNAVSDALAAAVGRVVMEMLTGETVVRRFQLINDRILDQRDQYIQNYRVLTESTSGNTIRTLVQVDVATERLSKDLSTLGLALSGTVYPRILFMIAEKNATDADSTYWWGSEMHVRRAICERALASAMGDEGFEILPTPSLDAPLNLPASLSQADMRTLGNRLGADILVAGTGVASAATNTMGGTVQAFQATVDVQAFDVQSGKPIGRTLQKAVASAQDAVAGGSDALTNAGTQAGDDLARKVMAAWQRKQDGSAVIDVAVEGTSGQIASFVKLRTAITSLSGVKELKMKEMATDHALMAVNYQGTARSMADALLLKTFNGFGIDIYEVTPQTIRIRLINN